ncbi:MAG: tryptophan synthase subunit alpha [Rickettsiales bacterium]
MSQRIAERFAALKAQNKTALIPFIMGGDPTLEASVEILHALPKAGADLIEIGIPFSDPTADGPSIQKAGLRALNAKTTLVKILEMVRGFRIVDAHTPLILMGYYNPVLQYGPERFATDAAKAGVDGIILVDLPPEEEDEITPFLEESGISLVRLIAPTTQGERLKTLLKSASGFVYTIAIKGITGAGSADKQALQTRIKELKSITDLPVVAGFGIRTKTQVDELKGIADGVVVGSALVDAIAEKETTKEMLNTVEKFLNGLKAA